MISFSVVWRGPAPSDDCSDFVSLHLPRKPTYFACVHPSKEEQPLPFPLKIKGDGISTVGPCRHEWKARIADLKSAFVAYQILGAAGSISIEADSLDPSKRYKLVLMRERAVWEEHEGDFPRLSMEKLCLTIRHLYNFAMGTEHPIGEETNALVLDKLKSKDEKALVQALCRVLKESHPPKAPAK